MVAVAQLVRASHCGCEGCRFDPDLPPDLQFVKTIVTETLYACSASYWSVNKKLMGGGLLVDATIWDEWI